MLRGIEPERRLEGLHVGLGDALLDPLATDPPTLLPRSAAALCLSLAPRALPEDSPAWAPPEPGADRRHLELFFLERDPREVWEGRFRAFGERQAEARMGQVQRAAGFVPTVPGTDRYTDEV